jgi:hypothetical protein
MTKRVSQIIMQLTMEDTKVDTVRCTSSPTVVWFKVLDSGTLPGSKPTRMGSPVGSATPQTTR